MYMCVWGGGGVPIIPVMSEFFSAVFLRGLLPHGDQWKLICSKYQKKVCDSTTVPHGLVCNGMPVSCREVNLWFVLTPQGRIHTTHNTQASSPHSNTASGPGKQHESSLHLLITDTPRSKQTGSRPLFLEGGSGTISSVMAKL